MSFLAPLFIAGGLLIGLPILFHLIRRTTREVTPFSSLMFLLPTPPRVTQRSRIDNLLLLLLRCLAVLLLALAFARPLLTWAQRDEQGEGGTGIRRIVLIDTSASMNRPGLWEAVQERAVELAADFPPGDAVAVLGFDQRAQPLLSYEQWANTAPGARVERVKAAVATVRPGWHGTALDSALLHAVDLLDTRKEGVRGGGEIVVISDLQEGSRTTDLQGFEWPKDIRVQLISVGGEPGENASVHWIAGSGGQGASAEAEFSPRLRVVNHVADAEKYQFKLAWGGQGGAKELDAYVPGGQSRVFRPKGVALAGEEIRISGDAVEFDNVVYVTESPKPRLLVLFAGEDEENRPGELLYFLRRAFPETSREEVEVRRAVPGQPLNPADLKAAQLLVLGRNPAAAALEGAKAFAESGKIVLVPCTPETRQEDLRRLLGTDELTLREARVRDYAMLTRIDFSHPFFQAFADPRFSDFTKIRFWKHRQLGLEGVAGAKVLAQFDDGDSAIVQVPLGQGTAVLLTSSWLPADGQLALSTKFVPLLHSVLAASSPIPFHSGQYFVGDDVLLSAREARTVKRPDGREITVQAGARFSDTDIPGLYTVADTGSRFAVNLNPEESQLAPSAADRLKSLAVPIADPAAAVAEEKDGKSSEQRQAEAIEARQKLWRWLILAAVVILLLETLLAGRLARPAASPAAATL